MELTNLLCAKFGTDKLLHFAFGALVPALLLPFGIMAVGIGAIVIFILSIVKEVCLDNNCDFWDAGAGIIAAFLVTAYSMAIYNGLDDTFINPKLYIEQYNNRQSDPVSTYDISERL